MHIYYEVIVSINAIGSMHVIVCIHACKCKHTIYVCIQYMRTYRVNPPAEQIGDEEIYSVFGQTSVGHHGQKEIGTRCVCIFSGFLGRRF